MRCLAMAIVLGSAALAQQTSSTGFGRMLYPGTGGPTGPNASRGGGRIGSVSTGGGGYGRILYPGTGAPAAIRSGLGPAFVGVPPNATHQQHGRSAIIPFPIFYGGGYSAGYYAAFEPPPAATRDYDPYDLQRAPVVIINQAYQPEQINPQLRDYSTANLPPAAPRPAPPEVAAAPRDPHADDPTIYQIVLMDGTIFEAVGYWVEGDILHYVTLEGGNNLATLNLVDRAKSMELNAARKVDFKLPKR